MPKAFQIDTDGTLNTNLKAYYKAEDAVEFFIGGGTLDFTNNGTTPFNAAKVNNGFDGGASNSTKWMNGNHDYGVHTGNFSISFWFKNATAPGAEQGLFWLGKNAASGQFFRGWIDNGPNITFYRRGNADDRADYAVSPGTSVFHHFVGTYDGTNIKLYVDGTLRATTPSGGSGTPGRTQLAVMSDNSGTSTPSSAFSGLVDELGIWAKVLSAQEIADLYNAGAGQTMVDESGPPNLKAYNTNLKANIKTINTNPIANVKSLNTNV